MPTPFEYPDDDIFGYMRAMKKAEGGTLTRLSPLKCSPLVSVLEQTPTDDFGVMARQEGDAVPFEHQFYSTVLKGIFSLDLSNVGVYCDTARTGFRNLDEKYVEKPEIQASIKKASAKKENGIWALPKAERIKRTEDTISTLPYLYSTTKASGHLTDVTPKFIILTVINGGNHIFMNITNNSHDKPLVNVTALNQVLSDYNGSIVSDVFIGRQEGFMDEAEKELDMLEVEGTTIHQASPKKTVEAFVDCIKEHID